VTTVADISLREQELDSAGHADDCAAYDDKECSCGIGAGPVAPDYSRIRKTPRTGPSPRVIPIADSVVLEGQHAAAYREWVVAMQELGNAKNALETDPRVLQLKASYAQAGQRAQAAQERLTQLSVGMAP
jgi:hypothetical protein